MRRGSSGNFPIDDLVLIALAVLAVIYVAGSLRLRMRGSSGRGLSHLLFAGGMLSLVAILVPPLHAMAEKSFFAHMIAHEVLMAVAVPLLVAAQPAAALIWGLPESLRQGLARSRMFAGGRIVPLDLGAATLLQTVLLWGWHAPPAFNAALSSEGMHFAQHASFGIAALLFWAAVLDRDRRRHNEGGAALALFFTAMHAGLLGALLTLSARPWYASQTDPAIAGLTPLADQALGGLIMWVPGCSIYLAAAVLLVGRWLNRMEEKAGAG